MVKNKVPMYEQNTACSEFVPSSEPVNVGLQNTQVDNLKYDNVKIEDMRDNPMYNNRLSDLDKIADVQAEQLRTIPEVKKVAKVMTELKQVQTGQGKNGRSR